MLVELDRLVEIELGVSKHAALDGASTQRVDDRSGSDALVNVQWHRLNVEGQMFGLARPLELRVKARVVLVALTAGWRERGDIGQASRRIVESSLIVAVVGGGRRGGRFSWW